MYPYVTPHRKPSHHRRTCFHFQVVFFLFLPFSSIWERPAFGLSPPYALMAVHHNPSSLASPLVYPYCSSQPSPRNPFLTCLPAHPAHTQHAFVWLLWHRLWRKFSFTRTPHHLPPPLALPPSLPPLPPPPRSTWAFTSVIYVYHPCRLPTPVWIIMSNSKPTYMTNSLNAIYLYPWSRGSSQAV